MTADALVGIREMEARKAEEAPHCLHFAARKRPRHMRKHSLNNVERRLFGTLSELPLPFRAMR